MKIRKCISIVVWAAFLASFLLNIGLICGLINFRKASIDLRHVSVVVSREPPNVFDVRDLFYEGDTVISIIDTANINNSITLFCRGPDRTDVTWHAVIKGNLFCGGVANYKRGR